MTASNSNIVPGLIGLFVKRSTNLVERFIFRLSADILWLYKSAKERLNVLAAEMECFPSDLVDLLLQRGLAAIESGEWPLQRVPVKFRIDWASRPK